MKQGRVSLSVFTWSVFVICLFLSGSSFAAVHSQTWNRTINPREARDRNPDPNIVEVTIRAKQKRVSYGAGNRTKVWTYNGGIPGPTIRGNVGDTLIVHFYNRLPEDTTIHWHGLDVPANQDGSNISQNAVPPGGYFRYEFKLLRAATYWYHPHVRTNIQVEKGLYGALVVHDPDEDASLGLPSREHLLVLDDILLNDNNQIAEEFPTDPLANALTQLNGREGNKLLVNGKSRARGVIKRGVPHRLRLINASNSRFMRVSLKGHRMWQIGGDGGLLEAPIEILPIGMVPDPDNPGEMISDPDRSKGIILTPGERAEVVFTPRGHRPVKLEWHDLDRGRHSTFYTPEGTIGVGDAEDDGKRPPRTLMKFYLFGWHSGYEYTPLSTLRPVTPIDTTGAAPIPIMFGHTPPNASGDVTFFVQMKNGMPLPFPAVTPADAPTVNVGETKIWEVNNLTGGDHNFHTHGFTFQLIETEYIDMMNPDNNYVIPAPRVEVKDTILIPKRPGARGSSRTVSRLAVVFDDTGREGRVEAFGKVPGTHTSGGWLLHCHILEHSNRGMMTFFQVFNP